MKKRLQFPLIVLKTIFASVPVFAQVHDDYGEFGSADVVKHIVKKSDWADAKVPDDEKKLSRNFMKVPKYITLHHTEGPIGGDEISYLRSIRQNLHMKKGGRYEMGDIAYHFLIAPSGAIYEGRSLEFATNSGTRYYTESIWMTENMRLKTDRTNGRYKGEVEWVSGLKLTKAGVPPKPGSVEGHITICFLGDYFKLMPNDKVRDAFIYLVGYLMEEHDDIGLKNIWMHREVTNSSCPGDNIYDQIRVVPRSLSDHTYRPGPWLRKITELRGE
ncbi:MAG: peptidoglycan recognition family protein [Verrucomicrobiales bacterium]|nr:peptidoglycan recognition family protein [Verrucomicrobiales bacterium]